MANPRPAAKREVKPPRPFLLTTGRAAIVLAVLTILFFHEVAVGGRTFVSPDATNPAGFVRIGEHSLWTDHVYPLWNPFVFLGMPSFASGAYNPLIYPPDWPLAIVQKVVPLPDMTWMLLYYFLGGLFVFLLAREWGARAEGALLGAVAFVFTPNLVAVGSHGHGSQLVDTAYLPLLVWLATRWLRRGNLSDLGWLALAGGFQFLRGHVQICFYTWFAIATYAGVEVIAALRTPAELGPRIVRALGLGAAAALAFGLAGFYNLPLRDYAHYSIRGSGDAAGGVGLAYATGWSMAPYELPAIAFPNWVGFGDATYWGGMPFTQYPNAYVGIVAVLLALPAFLLRGTQRAFALVLALVALMISFGSYFPLYGFLYEHVPQFNKFRVPVMIIVLFQFAAALGAAWGWSAVLEQGREKKPQPATLRLVLAAGGVLLVALALGLVGRDAIRGGYVSFALAHRPSLTPALANEAFLGFAGDLVHVTLTGLVVLAVAWAALRGRLNAMVASVAMLGLLLFDLWPVSGKLMQPVIGETPVKSLDAGRDDVVGWLQKQGPWGTFRAYAPQDFMSNRLAGFGIAAFNGMHAAKPRLFQDLMDTNALSDPRWWRLLNMKYLVIGQELMPEETPPYLKSVYVGSAVVYENQFVLPRVTVVGAYGVVPDTGRAAIDSVRAGTHDAAAFTWLTKDPGARLGPVEGATAAITKYSLHDVDVDVTTPGPAIVRLADLWYPDWSVRVDGRPAEMLRADHLLRAVVVPAGRHHVAFHFESASVRRGLMLSIASAAIALLLLLAGALRGRRPKVAPAPPAAAGAA